MNIGDVGARTLWQWGLVSCLRVGQKHGARGVEEDDGLTQGRAWLQPQRDDIAVKDASRCAVTQTRLADRMVEIDRPPRPPVAIPTEELSVTQRALEPDDDPSSVQAHPKG